MSSFRDLSLGELGQLDRDVGEGLQTYFQAQPDATTVDLVTLRATTALDTARQEQVQTLLVSLGYLEDGTVAPAADEIEAAFARWRADQRLADGIRWKIGETAGGNDENLAALDAKERSRRRLKAAATLEGEVELTRLPIDGECTLLSRIAGFRIGLFNDTPLMAGAPSFPSEHSQMLAKITRLLGFPDTDATRLTVLNLLGDIGALTVQLQTRCSALVFRLPKESDARTSLLDWDHYVLASRRPAVRGMGKVPSAENLLQPGRLQHVIFGGAPASPELNEFAINFLQVRLWMLGYYGGKIDRDWGPRSWAALREFGTAYQLAWDRDSAAVVATSDQRGRRALDLGYFLTAFRQLVDEPADALEASPLKDKVDQILASAETQAPGQALWTRLDEASREENVASSARMSDPTSRAPRYFGWRGIFSTIGGFIHELFTAVLDAAKSLVQRVVEVLERSLALARQFVRFLADTTRMAVRIGKLALQRLDSWLNGTPVVTAVQADVCATIWQQDFDTVLFVSAGCPHAMQMQHANLLEWMNSSFSFLLAVALEIIGLVESLALAWWLFAWKVLAAIRDMVQEWREFAERAGLAGFFGPTSVA